MLREAEALAGLGSVAGPTDAPPTKAEDEDSWTRDWIQRARDALQKARAMHDEALRKGQETLRERAARIAQKLRNGAAAVQAGAKNILKETKEQLSQFHETARTAFTGWASMNAFFIVAALIGAAWYFTRK